MDYLNADEEKVVTRDVQNGQLICTDQRLVHFGRHETTDISISSIDVLKYYSKTHDTSSEGSILLGILIAMVGMGTVSAGIMSPTNMVAIYGGISALVMGGLFIYAGQGEKYDVERLKVRTPSGNFSFKSRHEENVHAIVHAVRAVENDQHAR